MQRIYLVIMNSPRCSTALGVHVDGSSEEATNWAWTIIQCRPWDMVKSTTARRAMLERGLRQICLGVNLGLPGRRSEIVELDASDCPHPAWMSLHPAFDFEALSRGETPPYIKRWLAFEAWAE